LDGRLSIRIPCQRSAVLAAFGPPGRMRGWGMAQIAKQPYRR